MKRSVWFIDGWEDRFSKLSEAKEHLNFAWTKKELEFEFKNGKLHFHKLVKESF